MSLLRLRRSDQAGRNEAITQRSLSAAGARSRSRNLRYATLDHKLTQAAVKAEDKERRRRTGYISMNNFSSSTNIKNLGAHESPGKLCKSWLVSFKEAPQTGIAAERVRRSLVGILAWFFVYLLLTWLCWYGIYHAIFPCTLCYAWNLRRR